MAGIRMRPPKSARRHARRNPARSAPVGDQHPPGQRPQQLRQRLAEFAARRRFVVGDAVDRRRDAAHRPAQANDAVACAAEVDRAVVDADPAEADDLVAVRVAAGCLQIERQICGVGGRGFRRRERLRQIVAQRPASARASRRRRRKS